MLETKLQNITNKKILKAAMLVLPVFAAMSICFNYGSNEVEGRADTTIHTITLDSTQKMTKEDDSQTAANFHIASATMVNPTDGGWFKMNCTSAKDSGNYFTTLNTGAKITNTTQICGLTNITVYMATSTSIQFRFGWESASYGVPKTYTGTKFECNFDGLCPKRFEFMNTSSKAVNIEKIIISYSCEDTECPADVEYAYLANGRTIKSAIGNPSEVIFSSVAEAIADGASRVGSSSYNGNVNDIKGYKGISSSSDLVDVQYYKKGNKAYICGNSEQPCIIFNTSCESMFDQCSDTVKFSVTQNCQIDTSRVVNFKRMFYALVHIDEDSLNDFLVRFDTTSGRVFSGMFMDCQTLRRIDVSQFEFTHKDGVDLSQMFYQCSACEEIKLSSTKMSKGTDEFTNRWNGGCFGHMFEKCRSLKKIDLSTFNFHEAFGLMSMFAECSNLETIYASFEDEPFSTAGYESYQRGDWCDPFTGCSKLVGGNGTKFATEKNGTFDMFRLDKPGQKGYFTGK